ncbi:coiled-coil domain-containing protein 57 isoform X2 [Antennarius striatus]|uniref:coiled-coil domain-containing protein 57 isoform X2 n=1 Tax=Antennarius striatus TaxID=241820 RepID=UPI0035B3CD82
MDPKKFLSAKKHQLECLLKKTQEGFSQRQNEEHERTKRDLRCRICELERELSQQKQLKLQSKETEVQCQAQLQEFCQQMQNLLEHKDQELKDLTAIKDYRIEELEGQLKWMEIKWKKEEDTNVKKYNLQLSGGLKREKALEPIQVEEEQECQRHCEAIKTEDGIANEQSMENHTQARDQAEADVQNKEQVPQNMAALLCSCDKEKDLATQGHTARVHLMSTEEICHLREQNNILQTLVNQMKKDMDSLNHLLLLRPQTIRPPAQSTDISSSLISADGLDLKKNVNTSSSAKQEVRSHITGQRVWRQKKKPLLRQQKISNFRKSDYFLENVQSTKSNHPPMHSRLKKAAFCIARLSREKQQLIEMNNHLRGLIITSGQKEGFPRKDLSTKCLKHRNDHLTALEQLQYHLTMQELQHGLKQRTSTSAEQFLPMTNKQCPTTKLTINTEFQEIDSPQNSKKNIENTQLRGSWSSLEEGPQPHSCMSKSPLSSEESLPSLKHLWKMMDCGFSTSTFSEGGEGEMSKKDAVDSGGAGDQMMVNGISAPIHSQPTTVVQLRRHPSSTPSNTTKFRRLGAQSRIRNYNVKD